MPINKVRSILIVMGLVVLLGCESRQFKAERKMFSAHKMAQAVYKNPKGTPPFQLQRAQDAYREIIKAYPDSLFAIQSQFAISHLYVVKSEFEKGRQEYGRLVKDCDKRGNVCAEAVFAMGKSYEIEDKWDQALEQYRRVMKEYPFSSKSLDLPIYVVRHYVRSNEQENASKFLDQAVAYYLDLKTKAKTKKGQYLLQTRVARAYIEGQAWEDALDTLNKLIRDYPQVEKGQLTWFRAIIYHNKLKDNDKARQELKSLIEKYPDSPFADRSKTVLEKL